MDLHKETELALMWAGGNTLFAEFFKKLNGSLPYQSRMEVKEQVKFMESHGFSAHLQRQSNIKVFVALVGKTTPKWLKSSTKKEAEAAEKEDDEWNW